MSLSRNLCCSLSFTALFRKVRGRCAIWVAQFQSMSGGRTIWYPHGECWNDLHQLMLLKQIKTIMQKKKQITTSRCYKPFPNGWFIIELLLFEPQRICFAARGATPIGWHLSKTGHENRLVFTGLHHVDSASSSTGHSAGSWNKSRTFPTFAAWVLPQRYHWLTG